MKLITSERDVSHEAEHIACDVIHIIYYYMWILLS